MADPGPLPGEIDFEDYPVDRQSCQLLGPTALVRSLLYRCHAIMLRLHGIALVRSYKHLWALL